MAVRQISAETGMHPMTVKTTLRLKRLVPKLRSALEHGKLAVNVAEAACRLPAELQAGLVTQLTETGKLSLNDVLAIRQGRAETPTSRRWQRSTASTRPRPRR